MVENGVAGLPSLTTAAIFTNDCSECNSATLHSDVRVKVRPVKPVLHSRQIQKLENLEESCSQIGSGVRSIAVPKIGSV